MNEVNEAEVVGCKTKKMSLVTLKSSTKLQGTQDSSGNPARVDHESNTFHNTFIYLLIKQLNAALTV